jgi:hypothetical protein
LNLNSLSQAASRCLAFLLLLIGKPLDELLMFRAPRATLQHLQHMGLMVGGQLLLSYFTRSTQYVCLWPRASYIANWQRASRSLVGSPTAKTLPLSSIRQT